MILRITIVAVATSIVGLFSGPALAQVDPSYPVMPAGYAACDGGCADAGDAAGGCAQCTDKWVTPGWLGTHHHPDCECPLCHPRHTWASFDALLWWGKGRTMPALVTTSPQGTPQASAGVLPAAGILFGNGTVGNGLAAGARADFGFWFDDCETIGLGAKIWGLGGDRQAMSVASPAGDPILARPFYNVVQGQQDAFLVSYPGIINGNMNVETTSGMIGAEAYLRTSMMSGRGYDLDLIGGYHFVRLDDDLSVVSNSISVDPAGAVAVGTAIDVVDVFDAHNEFHGGEVGVVGEARRGCWTVTGLAKMSVGNMRQTMFIDGSTTVTPPASAAVVSPGGLLAQPTNMGSYAQDKTAIIPEVGITLAYELRRWLRLSVGYNAIYLSRVAFSGDAIDTNVNPTQFGGNPLIGPPVPGFAFRDTDYWMHGLTLGATFTF